jgi:hypothetical protein
MLSVSSAMCAPGGVLLLSLPGACIRNSRYLNETVSLPPSSAFRPVFTPSLYFCHSAAAGLLHPSQSILPHILPPHHAKKPISAYRMRVAFLTGVLADKKWEFQVLRGMLRQVSLRVTRVKNTPKLSLWVLRRSCPARPSM